MRAVSPLGMLLLQNFLALEKGLLCTTLE